MEKKNERRGLMIPLGVVWFGDALAAGFLAVE